MVQIVFIGGLGSNPSQVGLVAQALSSHYDQEVIGLPFNEAQRKLAQVAQVARDSIVITHSAGVLLCEDMTPKEIIAIAPPVPGALPVMAWRAVTKTIALIKTGRISDERLRKVNNYHARAFREHILSPRYNIGQASRICQFDPAQLAVKMINRGVTVTLGFMEQDMLYPHSARHVHVDMARRHGAIVHEDIQGQHDEFLLYPLKILEQLNRL
jgi:hypothetical protein